MNRLSDMSGRSFMEASGMSDSANFYAEFVLDSANVNIQGTLLEIGAENCIACRRMKTTLEEIKKKYPGRLDIQIFNITDVDGLAMGKKFGMVMIPMQVLLNRNGEVVYKHVGFISAEELSFSIETRL